MAGSHPDYGRLSSAALFFGLDEEESRSLARCLGAYGRDFAKGETVLRQGSTTRDMGVVQSGGVRIESVDAWGDVTVLSHVGPGQTFAETYAYLPDEPLMVNVVAAQDSSIVFLSAEKLAHPCTGACARHRTAMANLTGLLARKNLALSRRSFIVAPKTIRGKVIAYLSQQALAAESDTFEIPFNRQQLADYLGVDRSALSSELGRMRRDGLINVRKSRFTLLGP